LGLSAPSRVTAADRTWRGCVPSDQSLSQQPDRPESSGHQGPISTNARVRERLVRCEVLSKPRRTAKLPPLLFKPKSTCSRQSPPIAYPLPIPNGHQHSEGSLMAAFPAAQDGLYLLARALTWPFHDYRRQAPSVPERTLPSVPDLSGHRPSRCATLSRSTAWPEEDRPHVIEDLEREVHTVRQRPAVFTGSLLEIGDRNSPTSSTTPRRGSALRGIRHPSDQIITGGQGASALPLRL
jgi:hypothetical protein